MMKGILVFLMIVLGELAGRPLLGQRQLDTLFPWPRINGLRMYGIGADSNIDVDPDLMHFDDTTLTATVTLINPAATPHPIWLAPECGGDGAQQPDDPVAATWHYQYRCAVLWVSGYPQYLVLAPHARQTLTLHLYPPPALPEGRYIGRLMINGIDHGGGHDETAIEYVKGPQRPQRSHARWVATDRRIAAHGGVQTDRPVLVLDDHTPTATVTFRNRQSTATEIWLTLDCPWFRVHYDTVSNYTHKSQYEFTWHLDVPNIVTWLSGYPQHLVLAPHAQRTVTLTLHPFFNGDPNLYPPGDYYAQLRYVQRPVLHVTASARETTFTTREGGVNIVYQRGAAASRQLVVSPVTYTRHSDGTGTACMTVQQPGLAVIAKVHAALVPDGTGGEIPRDRSTRWALDTTVVIWEVVHHRSFKRKDTGHPVPPDPICFALPDIDAGRYHLTVTAHALGGSEALAVPLPLEIL